jgi:hypothetical protein
MLNHGLDAWAFVDEDCPVSCEVIDDQAQFEVGCPSGLLHLVADQGALARLVDIAGKALAEWRATPADQRVCIILPDARSARR